MGGWRPPWWGQHHWLLCVLRFVCGGACKKSTSTGSIGVVLFGSLLCFFRPDFSAVSAVTSLRTVFFLKWVALWGLRSYFPCFSLRSRKIDQNPCHIHTTMPVTIETAERDVKENKRSFDRGTVHF
jgi:hypothetical protein